VTHIAQLCRRMQRRPHAVKSKTCSMQNGSRITAPRRRRLITAIVRCDRARDQQRDVMHDGNATTRQRCRNRREQCSCSPPVTSAISRCFEWKRMAS
jgi:hypothetical protein